MAASRAGRWARVVVAGALAVALGAVPATTARAGASADPQVYPVSLPAAAAQAYDGQDLRIGRVLGRTSAYARHAVTYRGSGLTISGVLTIPRGTGPFPVVVLAHGYIDPDVYTTGRGFLREQDHLARQGFAVLHVDYRNHAASDDDPDNDVNIRLGYAADVVNAGLAVRASGDPRLDGDRLGLLGRSMGGAVALSALVIEPGLFDAAVLYSSVSSSAADNFNRWQRSDDALRREVFRRHGSPERNPAFWAGVSPATYAARITEPVLMFHGESDDTCPIRWSRTTLTALRAAGVDARLVTYPGEGHAFFGAWSDSIRRSTAFLARNLGSGAS